MKFLKLLVSDKLSTVKVSVGTIISRGNIRILLSRQILHTKGARKLPPQTRAASQAVGGLFTVTAEHGGSDGTQRCFRIKASDPVAYIYFHVQSEWSFNRADGGGRLACWS